MDNGEDAETMRPAYRSKAETQIARLLDREGIPFQYEYPLAVVDRGQVRIWYPDFRLSDYGMIMEYFGLNGNTAYRKRTEHKLEVYRQNDIEGVFLTEESFQGDWPTRILGRIQGVLEDRLERFYRSTKRATPGGYQGANGAYSGNGKCTWQRAYDDPNTALTGSQTGPAYF